MRHRVSHRKLGRVTEHRIAMLRNQAQALLHERIETTVPRAKELRPFVERIITIAKRGLAGGDANGKCCTRGGWSCATSTTAMSSASCSTRSRRASRRGPAATRASCGSVPPRRQRRGRADRARRQRVQSERRDREDKRPRRSRSRASAAACGPPPSGCAARRPSWPRTKRRGEEGQPARESPTRRTRPARRQGPDPRRRAGHPR